jgi:hypothetical protein
LKSATQVLAHMSFLQLLGNLIYARLGGELALNIMKNINMQPTSPR